MTTDLIDSVHTHTVHPSQTPAQALILLHGRGSSAQNILTILQELSLPTDCLVLAPDAPQHSWYPYRFIEPKQHNEPQLTTAIATIHSLVQHLFDTYTLPTSAITLAGFSQGACLAAEYIKQFPTRYNAACIMSGGLIGSDEETIATIPGSLAHTPIYLGCDQEDFHIPITRVNKTATYFTTHNGKVSLRIYQHLGHTIHTDAFDFLNTCFQQ